MSEHKKRLAELFGLVKLDLDDAADTSRVKRKGKDADESALLGRQAFLEGDYASGIERFEEALAQDETPTPAREMDLAAAYEFVERSEEAEAIYGKLTENEAESAEARLALAEMSRRNSKFSEAIDQVERAIAKEPNSPLFHFKRAEMCRDAKLYRDALRSAERAALCEPDSAFFHYWLGDLLIEMKQFEAALEPLRNAIELSPGDDYYLLRAAVAFWGAAKPNEAIRAIRLATELDPENMLYRGVLELFLERSPDPDVRAQAKAIELEPYEQDGLERIAATLGIKLPSLAPPALEPPTSPN